jgi:hypothetical protein
VSDESGHARRIAEQLAMYDEEDGEDDENAEEREDTDE